MNADLMGVRMTPDVRAWDRDQRRVGSLIVLVAAGVLLVAAGLTFAFAQQKADVLYWVLAGILVLLLALEIAVFAYGRPGQSAVATPRHEGPPEPHLGPAGPSAAQAPAPRREARMLTLRCGDCATEFEITDTGERPLHHVCPGCGLEGVLREDAGGPAPPPAPAAPEVSPWAAPPPPPPAQPPAPPAAAPPSAPAVKKLKLRCGGCREVFSIEDGGERPLRRPCPHCGRVGEVR